MHRMALASSAAPALVDVVLPTLDEAGALRAVLAGLPPGYRALVVDNGSTDGSGELAAVLGASVVHEPRRGFGAACAAGLAAATADVVAFCDADGSLDLSDLPLVCGPVLRGEAELVLGARRPEGRGAWPAHARLANRYLSRRVRAATGAPLTDLGPMRAARRDLLLALAVRDRRSGWPLEQVLRAGAAGWRITEVAVPYRPRTGRSKVTGSVTGTVVAVRDMARVLRDLS
jgi:glycosyltransferase involved in cell wall biosynthesis